MQVRLAIALTLGLGLWVFWPTLELGLFADDYVATAMASGRFAAPRGSLDLFNFANGTSADVAALQRLGSLPWWAPTDFNVSFMRPLSSLLWHVDRALFGDALWAYHAHSIAAWALLVVAVAALYRRLLSPWLAALATLIYGLDDSLHFPVTWLSNRGGLYAMALGLMGLRLHVRWRETANPRAAWGSAGCFCAALAFGEWAFAALAYVLAYELCSDLRRPLERARCLLPASLPALVFLALRSALGYGARGSGAYIDPGNEPLRFAGAAIERIPVLIADMVWGVPASWWDHGTRWRDDLLSLHLFSPELWQQLPSWRTWHWLLGCAAALALLSGMRACRGALEAGEARTLRWLALGSVLALVPVVGSFTSTRLTLGAVVGLAPLVAVFLRELARVAWSLRSPARFAAAYAGIVLLLWLSLLRPLTIDLGAHVRDHLATTQWALSAELDDATVADQRVFLLSSGEFTTSFFFPYIWGYHGRPMPRSFYPISTAPLAHQVQRIGDRTLRLTALGGGFLDSGQEYMFRDSERPPALGERVQLPGVEILIRGVLHGHPNMLELRFEHPLDDPSQVFLISTALGLTRFDMPRPGQSRRIRRAAHPSWLGLERARERHRLGRVPEFLRYTPSPRFMEYGAAASR